MPCVNGRTRARALVVAACAAPLLAACSGKDNATGAGDTAAVQAPAATTAAAPADSASRSGRTTVRGHLASVSDTDVTVTTRDGDVRVALMQPVTIYTRVPATLGDVRANTFVGVTSVPDPDGSQRATEIHIFPEALRGTGEGSYPLPQSSTGASASRSTMTNGSVTAGGSAAASRMTNGAARVQPGGTITVQYQGGTQTIKVPAGVPVTKIAPSRDKLTPGANVIVVAMKQPAGTLQSSTIFLAHDTTSHH